MAIPTVGCESYLLFALTQVETIHRDGYLNESAAAGDATGAPTAIDERETKREKNISTGLVDGRGRPAVCATRAKRFGARGY